MCDESGTCVLLTPPYLPSQWPGLSGAGQDEQRGPIRMMDGECGRNCMQHMEARAPRHTPRCAPRSSKVGDMLPEQLSELLT